MVGPQGLPSCPVGVAAFLLGPRMAIPLSVCVPTSSPYKDTSPTELGAHLTTSLHPLTASERSSCQVSHILSC